MQLYDKARTDELLADKLSDAPSDGSIYGRKDAAWEVITASSSVNNVSTYTLTAGDANNIVLVSGGGTLTVPQDSTYSFPIGTKIVICSPNGGEIIVPESTGGMIVPSINQYQTSISIGYGKTLVKTGSDDWYVF